jgi:hypothetical protein
MCPAGFYGPGNTTCTVCPTATPYSMAGSGNMSQCTNCSSGCSSGTFGAYLCPTAVYTDWSVWYDTTGVEGNNSCFRYVQAAVHFNASGASCRAAGGHLLSSKQVHAQRQITSFPPSLGVLLR